ncbi:MAG: site-specific DNA-methyltransferase [Candidatus Peribacteria bacterium]|nr:site-specific DNA-methyltransferase [Candidatus Peribacteria bacterium]
MKNNPVPTFNGKYLTDKEYCIFIREGGATFNVQKGEYDKYRSRYKDSIGNSEYNHPTIKPLRMIKRQIEISSNKGDIVLDPYL